MKPIKKFVLALVFVSSLALTTYAGDVETPGFVPPPPPPPDRSMTYDPLANYPTELEDQTVEQPYETYEVAIEALWAVVLLF